MTDKQKAILNYYLDTQAKGEPTSIFKAADAANCSRKYVSLVLEKLHKQKLIKLTKRKLAARFFVELLDKGAVE